ncbi:MAG: outer membrane protein assembly factor BamA [Candidatus Methylacidiphilales bacterium]|nr:outer membrane protein assembly factor BamA [Candidatus Methylacidiphilales bacterium]
MRGLLGLLLCLGSSAMLATAAPTATENKTVVRPPSAADESSKKTGPTIKEVEIQFAGPRSVDRSVILSNMRSTVGQPYSLASVEEDVRNLYATGLFVNLRIYDEPLGEGVKVVVVVQPKPIVKQVVVVGNDKISEKAVRKKITSKPGDPLSEQNVATDSRAILSYYNTKGFANAQVEYKIDINEQVGRAVVTYTIKEEAKAFVDLVEFEGNKALESTELRKLFKTRKKNLLSIFNKSGLYIEDQFKEDLKKLREHYQSKGYIDMQVKDVRRSYPEADRINIKIIIFEGIPYKVGALNLAGNQLFTQEQIKGRMAMKESGTFSPQGLDADVKAIRDLYGERGYIDANVTPQRQPNVESGRMDIVYNISEGPQSYVEKIVIQGNNRTKDKVLRRELALNPGDVYDSVAVEASKKRLENLGYFSKVDISPEDTAVEDRKNMVVTVEEQRTGSVTFGAGFSTVDSLLGFVELSQGNFDFANWPNFTGAGQKFRTRLQYGLSRQDALVSWTEPWFMNQKLSFGFDLFYNNAQYLSNDYDQRRYGAAIRLGKALNDFWRVGLRYQAEVIDIYDVSTSLPNLIQNEEGARTKSSVLFNISYDNRDDLFLTRKGEKVEFSAEAAGGPLMGDTKIWKLQLEGSKYYSLPWDLILGFNGATGVADGFDSGDTVPLYDRFFLGGSRSIRGFKYRDVGPKLSKSGGNDVVDINGEPVGGQTMAYGNAEITYPIIDRVRGAIFVDGGINNTDTFDYGLEHFSLGTGVGLRLNLPIGPLRLDLGFPVVKEKELVDGPEVEFHFDVGYQF